MLDHSRDSRVGVMQHSSSLTEDDDDTMIALSRGSTNMSKLGSTLPALKGIIDSHILPKGHVRPSDSLGNTPADSSLKMTFHERHEAHRPSPLVVMSPLESSSPGRLRQLANSDVELRRRSQSHPLVSSGQFGSPQANILISPVSPQRSPKSPKSPKSSKSPMRRDCESHVTTPRSRVTNGDDAGGETNDDEEEEDTSHDQLLYHWKCPRCHGVTDLQMMLEKSATPMQDPLDGTQREGNLPYGQENDEFGEDGYVTEGESEPTPAIGEVGFEPRTFMDKAWLSIEVTDTHCPPYTSAATVVVSLGLVLVMVSVVTFLIESLPQYHEDPPRSLEILEVVCVGYFTLELVLRLVFCPNLKEYVTEAFTIIDFLSILPFYITLMVGKTATSGLPLIRILRLMKVFRVLKVTKYNEAVHVVFGSLQKSTEGLYLLLFLILISTILFSSAMYFIEREFSHYDATTERWYTAPAWDPTRRQTPFQSITHTFWWALVTLTTVGYGNDVPFSSAGKAVAVVTMLCGTLVIAFPMLIIGQNFQEMYGAYKRKMKGKRRRQQRAKEKRREGRVRKKAGGAAHHGDEANADHRTSPGRDGNTPQSTRGHSPTTGSPVGSPSGRRHHSPSAAGPRASHTILRCRAGSMVSRASVDEARRGYRRSTILSAANRTGTSHHDSLSGMHSPTLPSSSPAPQDLLPTDIAVSPFAIPSHASCVSSELPSQRTSVQLRALEDRLKNLTHTLDVLLGDT